MSEKTGKMAPRTTEVLMVSPESVRQIEQLAMLGWRAKRIARQLGMRRETVSRPGVSTRCQRLPQVSRPGVSDFPGRAAVRGIDGQHPLDRTEN